VSRRSLPRSWTQAHEGLDHHGRVEQLTGAARNRAGAHDLDVGVADFASDVGDDGADGLLSGVRIGGCCLVMFSPAWLHGASRTVTGSGDRPARGRGYASVDVVATFACEQSQATAEQEQRGEGADPDHGGVVGRPSSGSSGVADFSDPGRGSCACVELSVPAPLCTWPDRPGRTQGRYLTGCGVMAAGFRPANRRTPRVNRCAGVSQSPSQDGPVRAPWLSLACWRGDSGA